MAKKKYEPKKVAAMLILIALVWGAVFYKIFFKKKEGSFVPNLTQLVKNEKIAELDESVYRLKNNYTDPFLGESYKIAKPKKKSDANLKKEIEVDNELKRKQEEIRFRGVIQNDNIKTAYVVFRAKSYLLKRKDSLDQFILQRIRKDSIQFSDRKNNFWITNK